MLSEVPPAPSGSASLDEHRRRGQAPVEGATKGRVLVLNATFEPINVCTVRRAAVLLLKSKAEVIEHASWELHSESLTLPRPVVIRLVTYVRVPRDTHRRTITSSSTLPARASPRPGGPTCPTRLSGRFGSESKGAPRGAPLHVLLDLDSTTDTAAGGTRPAAA